MDFRYRDLTQIDGRSDRPVRRFLITAITAEEPFERCTIIRPWRTPVADGQAMIDKPTPRHTEDLSLATSKHLH